MKQYSDMSKEEREQVTIADAYSAIQDNDWTLNDFIALIDDIVEACQDEAEEMFKHL